MGLTGLLLRAAATRPHVLIAAVPGATDIRLAAEAALRLRGWPVVQTPADADLLLVAGSPGDEYDEVIGRIWDAMPAPRSRLHAQAVHEVGPALDRGRAELAAFRSTPAPSIGAPDNHAPGGHDGDGMKMPGGLPMADRAADRDGLKLDQLHVPLGPVLAAWPDGLVLRLVLQGDVVARATVETPGCFAGSAFWTEPWRDARAGAPVTVRDGARRRIGAHADSLARFLAVAGWDDAATAARRLRDDVLFSEGATMPELSRLTRRVERSQSLAWLTRGLGVLTPDDAVVWGVRGPARRAAGDVTARYRQWCLELRQLAASLEDTAPLTPAALEPPRGRVDGSGALLDVLPSLLAGTELAAARLIVASLDPDLAELAAVVEVAHGH